jgi:hypothetical protein
MPTPPTPGDPKWPRHLGGRYCTIFHTNKHPQIPNPPPIQIGSPLQAGDNMKQDLVEEIFRLIDQHMSTAGAGLTTYQVKALRVIIPTIIFRYLK